MKQEIPKVWVYLKRHPEDNNSWIAPDCPFCGGKHSHGAGPSGENPLDYLDPPRRAHCTGGGEYRLVPYDLKKLTRKTLITW